MLVPWSCDPVQKSSTGIYELIIFSGEFKKVLNDKNPDIVKREGTYIISVKPVEDK